MDSKSEYTIFVRQNTNDMTKIAATKENNATVKALKKMNECKWVGNTTHPNLDRCLTAINLECARNSGWYKPECIRINGLSGIYMINEDGSILPDYRVIKKEESTFLIETLTTSGYNEFEKYYLQFLKDETQQ